MCKFLNFRPSHVRDVITFAYSVFYPRDVPSTIRCKFPKHSILINGITDPDFFKS